MKCEKCGKEMIFKIVDHTQGWYCNNCDYAVVTSYFSDFELDETIYKVIIEKIIPSINQIKVYAKIGNCNFLESKKLLESGRASISGKAMDINEKISILKNNDISFEINPKYPY